MIVALIGLLLLSVIPAIFSGSSTIIQPTLGQDEDPFPPSVYLHSHFRLILGGINW
jgi:hypothetical protein